MEDNNIPNIKPSLNSFNICSNKGDFDANKAPF